MLAVDGAGQRLAMRREDVPDGKVLCDYCVGKCCKYIAIPIDPPKDWDDYDAIRWYVSHEDVIVLVEDRTWYALVFRRCRHLQEDYRCGIYETRMKVCREHEIENCEYEEHYTYDLVFETDEQVAEYAEAMLGDNGHRRQK